jgi:protocatechuate 3,4-dioxygenase beta subunit
MMPARSTRSCTTRKIADDVRGTRVAARCYPLEYEKMTRPALALLAVLALVGAIVWLVGSERTRRGGRSEAEAGAELAREVPRLALADAFAGRAELAGSREPLGSREPQRAPSADTRIESGAFAEGVPKRAGVPQGLSISGEVRWSDGQPVSSIPAQAFVRVKRGSHVWIDDFIAHDGRFEVGGLEPGIYRVEAKAVEREEVAVRSPITGRERKRTERTTLVAEVDAPAGAHGLVLVLSTGLELAGRVHDERGLPVEGCSVRARMANEEPEASLLHIHRGPYTRTSDAGRFLLTGLTSGEWRVEGSARGHATSGVLLTLPAGGPVTLVLPREARVIGVVLDAAGDPVDGAVVRAERRDADGLFAEESRDETDRRGVFRLSGLAFGTFLLGAQARGSAPSAPVEVELLAGGAVEDVVLRLQPAARLTGEVVDSDGREVVGVPIQLEAPGVRRDDFTDGSGAFAFEDLPVGRGRVSTHTRDGELGCEVALRANETTHVRLAPASALVRLRGRVTAGGEPLAHAQLRASRGADGDATFAAAAVADDAGVYALVLPGAGSYWVAVSSSTPELGWQVPLDVPEAMELVHDLDVPLGRVSGRVTDARGNPLADIVVASEPEQHEHGRHGSSSATTDALGRYALALPPGNHAVLARGGADHAAARIGGLVLAEGEHRSGVDLVLRPGGTLAGRVRRADGTAAPEVELFADGAPFPRSLRSIGRTGRDGRFEIEGLEPGTLTLVAGVRAAASRPQRIEIRAGETHTAELELSPATDVHLLVRDARGALVGSDVELHDENGARQVVRSGERAGDLRLGPLLPGRYRISAWRDGRTTARTLDVAGEERLELELVLE